MSKLNKILKSLLDKSNLSENELSRRTGIPQQIINRILLGQNKNPKIATLKPLAHYFMVSISQLIGDLPLAKEANLNISHAGWNEIPIIDGNTINPLTLSELTSRTTTKMSVDIQINSSCFAIKLDDSSMEPKFSKGTLLVFDHLRKIINTNFGLIYIHAQQKTVFRQLFIKQENIYIKCLNPKLKCYKLKQRLLSEDKYLGTLIQSKINY